MSKVNLTAKDWCDLVFEGRNKEYGAYRLRANSGRRQRNAVIWVLISIAAILLLAFSWQEVKNAFGSNAGDSEMETEFAELKKEEPKEEKKIDKPKEEPKEEIVEVKSSIQFTVPKIVDDNQVEKQKELKTQEDVQKSKFTVASMDIKGSDNATKTIDDLKSDQKAGSTNTEKKKEEVQDNAMVEVPATYPGGEAALIAFVNSNTVYPEIAQEQEVQGTVVLRFKVDKDGSVSDVKVKKSLTKECDAEAIKVVKKLKRFIPAKSQGHPVAVWFTLPVRFQLR
ncbi:MAG: energy transducer TonB [Alloprevotella sp.]|nr:energy transducer TonB [Alloprevotella sp.]